MSRLIKKLNLDFLDQLTRFGEASYTNAVECFFYNKKLLEETIKKELKNYKSSTAPEWLTTDYIDIHVLRELSSNNMYEGRPFPIRTMSENCFASMWRGFGHYHDRYGEVCDEVIYACKFTHHNSISLSSYTIQKWVTLCLENGMLPEELDYEKAITEGLFNINLLDHVGELLYIYLSNARVIQEEPSIVAFAIHLIDVLDCDFFLAYIIAERFCRKGPLHSYLSLQSRIASKQGIADRKVKQLEQAKKLHTFITKQSGIKNSKKTGPPKSNPKVSDKVYHQSIENPDFAAGREMKFKKCRFDEIGQWIRDVK